MKSCPLLSLVFFISVTAAAQQRYTIIYETKTALIDTTRNVFSYPGITLAIRDSLSYCYYPEVGARLKISLRKNIPLGSISWPKSEFTNVEAGYYLFQTGPYERPKKLRLVENTCKKGLWTFTDESKSIAGYTCKKATGLLNGRNIVAWYAPDLPAGFGPFLSHDLPGTVLQYWYPDGMYITTATIVSKGAFEIVEPNYCKRISRAEYEGSGQ